MPETPPDEPELPRLPDPADPPAGEPDTEPEPPVTPAASEPSEPPATPEPLAAPEPPATPEPATPPPAAPEAPATTPEPPAAPESQAAEPTTPPPAPEAAAGTPTPEAPEPAAGATPPLLVGGAGAAGAAGGGEGDVPPPPPPAPGETGEGGGKSGKGILVAIGALVGIIVIGGLAWYLISDDDSGPGPEEAVRDYFDALQDGECGRLVDLVEEKTWSQGGEVSRKEAVAQCQEEVDASPDFKATLDKVKVVDEKDDKATVSAKVTVNKQSDTVRLQLVKEDGDWKLANL